MTVVIWWGTDNHAARRGVVVDVCVRCAAVRPCLIVDHFAVWHVCGVGVGEPPFMGSTRACTICHQHHAHEEGTYSDVLPVGDLELLSLEQGIRRTNPRLSGLLDVVARARALVTGPAYRAADLDESRQLLEAAADRFEHLVYGGADVAELAEALDRWTRLSGSEREELAANLAAALEARMARRRTTQIARWRASD